MPDLDTPITTTEALQERIDSSLNERLARERAKFQDYDELKTFKSTAAETLAAANKALDERQATIDQLNGTLSAKDAESMLAAARQKVADEKKVPTRWITGDTPEAMAASADEWLVDAKSLGKPGVIPTQGTGDPNAQTNPYEAGRERAQARYNKKN